MTWAYYESANRHVLSWESHIHLSWPRSSSSTLGHSLSIYHACMLLKKKNTMHASVSDFIWATKTRVSCGIKKQLFLKLISQFAIALSQATERDKLHQYCLLLLIMRIQISKPFERGRFVWWVPMPWLNLLRKLIYST